MILEYYGDFVCMVYAWNGEGGGPSYLSRNIRLLVKTIRETGSSRSSEGPQKGTDSDGYPWGFLWSRVSSSISLVFFSRKLFRLLETGHCMKIDGGSRRLTAGALYKC